MDNDNNGNGLLARHYIYSSNLKTKVGLISVLIISICHSISLRIFDAHLYVLISDGLYYFLFIPIIFYFFIFSKKSSPLLRHSIILVIWFFTFSNSVLLGGVESYNSFYLLLVPAGAALLQGRKAAILGAGYALFSLIIYTGMFLFEIDTYPLQISDQELLNLAQFTMLATVMLMTIFTYFSQAIFCKLRKSVMYSNRIIKNLVFMVGTEIKNYVFVIETNIEDVLSIREENIIYNTLSKNFGMISMANKNILDIIRDSSNFNQRDEKIEVSFEKVDPKEIIKEINLLFSNRLEDKKLTLNINNNLSSECLIWANKSILNNQIVNNVISNAIKFSYEGTKIDFSFDKEQLSGNIIIIIKDYGIGIGDELLTNLFNVEKKTSRTGTNGEKGTGFGMPIVRRYILAIGGSIEVISNNSGTQFILRLPEYQNQKENIISCKRSCNTQRKVRFPWLTSGLIARNIKIILLVILITVGIIGLRNYLFIKNETFTLIHLFWLCVIPTISGSIFGRPGTILGGLVSSLVIVILFQYTNIPINDPNIYSGMSDRFDIIFFGTITVATCSFLIHSTIKVMSNKILENNNQIKSLLQVIGHDISNSLAVIHSGVQLVGLNEDNLKYINVNKFNKIKKNTILLKQIIDNIHAISSYEAGKEDIELSKSSIAHLVSDSFAGLSNELKNKHISWDIDNSLKKNLQIQVQEDIFVNKIMIPLIRNAIKYSCLNGQINILIRSNRKYAIIIIKDDGMGIVSDENMFISKYIISAVNNRRFENDNMELVSAQIYIQLMNGNIYYKSGFLKNNGTEVYIELPLN